MSAYFVRLFADYPKVKRFVRLYHPDLQGPMDVLELLWGSDMFLGLCDTPDLARAALDRIVEVYGAFLDAWHAIAPPAPDVNPHWWMWCPGQVVLRDDSAMNLSPAMYAEFVAPWNEKLFARYHGGTVHACGRVEHWIDLAARTPGFKAFNMSQPQLNDMEIIWRATVDRGICVLGFNAGVARETLAAGRDLRGRVHIVE